MFDPDLERRVIALFQQAVDVPQADLRAWVETQTQGEPQLKTRLVALLRANDIASLRTGGAADAVEDMTQPERIGAYRIVEQIGRGGMGAIYRGERDTGDFAHTAAIKLIKPGLLSEKLVERFQRERQTLASLEHPNIARLYDGGATADGAPFIIMEFVDGERLLDWCAQRGLQLHEKLNLFCDVCEAVAFAHRNLIVHRDITPSNVLVTRDGVVKLIDFGIARPATESIDLVAPPRAPSSASLSLTPGYAAPERMAGAEATTSADIYSLGKLLDSLVKPDAQNRELAAIISSATANLPTDRYQTADALRADIMASQNRQPVAAMRGGRRYLISKFVARHMASVIAVIVALALLVGALVSTLLANERAEVARAKAEQRFEQTRSIAKSLLFDVFDGVSKVSGSTKAREKLARTGLTYLDALATDKNAPLDVQVETGRGYTRLAEVVGGGQAGQLGKYEDSNVLLAKAEAILVPAYAKNPDSPGVQKAYAALLLEQSGTNLYNNNKPELARTQAQKVQTVLGKIKSQDAETASIIALAIQAEADSYGWNDDFEKALPIHQRTEKFIAGLAPDIRSNSRVLRARSSNLRLLGETLHKLKLEPAARIALDQAVAINRQLHQRDPDDPMFLRKLVTSLWYRAVVHRTNMRDQLARESIEEAVILARQLHQRDPNDAGGLQVVALTGEVYAQVLGDRGDYAQSYDLGDEVIAAHRKLVELSGNTPGALRSMATALSTQGGNFHNGGADARACTAWSETLSIFMALDKRGVLTGTDRKNGLPEVKDYIRDYCSGPISPHLRNRKL
jgi:eukaryotic-like serine/threonine-protein kinase